MSNTIRLLAVLCALVLHAAPGMAEDIDIYASSNDVDRPNVLVIIDNSANWSRADQGWPVGKQGQSELAAFRTVVNELNDHLNVGLMLFTEGSGTNKDGGYVRFRIRQMTGEHKGALQELIGDPAGCVNGPNSHNGTPNCIYQNYDAPAEKVGTAKTDYSAVMFEAFKYFGGYTSPAHATDDVAGSPVDASHFGALRYAGNPDAKIDPSAYSTDAAHTSYNTPITHDQLCAKNFIIFIGNGFPSLDSPASLLTGVGGDSAQIPVPVLDASGTPTATYVAPASSKINYADEWAKFLNLTDVSAQPGQQKVTTYTIDVFKDKQDTNQTQLLYNMARVGGGKYFKATDPDKILDALRKIFSEIQSVNSVFASSSLPVSVNTQGTYLNQVYMGMFRPDGNARPRWNGNLKQYKFKFFEGVLRLSDKNGEQAISSTTGFITPCSDSFWTTDSGPYWSFSSITHGLCSAQTSNFPAANSSSAYSDAPDGDVVEKGGAAQRLRGVGSSGGTLIASTTNYATRALRTCDPATGCTTLTSFETANTALTAAAFGVSTATDKDNLINWVRGQDLLDENGNGVVNEVRPSVHGDVIHSQPAAVDYGGTTGVITYYGAEDGVLHAVDGGQTDAEGTELWGFIAPETFGRLFRLKDNGTTTPYVNLPGVIGTVAPKDYFFDGSISVYQKSSTVWIFPSMRRGGRALYAFDVSTPASPVLKWRKGCFTNLMTDDTSCTAGWSAIGQTWSKPQLGYLTGYVDGSSNLKPVLVFGGGYDTCEDTNSQTRCTGTIKGNNVWFVDADSGAILRTYPTQFSVPGDVRLIKDLNTGVISHVYAGDSGGNLYRINVGSYDGTTFTGWTSNAASGDITIAQLSETGNARKFLFGPDVVQFVGYNAVLIGSGDREHPLAGSYQCEDFASGGGVQNQFYMIKDTPNIYPSTPITPADLTDVSSSNTFDIGSISNNGWRFNLGTCEQTVNKALTIGGTTYFGTNAPTQTGEHSCSSNLGVARGYAVNFLTGSAVSPDYSRSVTYQGGGLPPSPVAGVVEVDGVKVPFIIGGGRPDIAGSQSALEGSKVTINPSGTRTRVYWYQETD